ncbi:hypothetical protein ACFWZZ_00470 [[Kitasatospora] papulosa]|uniref:hypothetical protein n=1 Tax=Streptomyces TaxID=1883 RepID=UPI00332C9B6C
MTGADWAVLVLALSWLGVCVCLIGRDRAMAADETPTEPVLFAADYMPGFERLRTAIAEADMETEPGAPSADLIDCWAIWPDAPTHAGEDGTR